MTAPLIEVRDFSFRIDGKDILREVSLDILEGAHLSIVGPNGAGKTTLLRCLLRILTGGQGTIHVAGRPLESYGQRELARLMSYVPQAGGRAVPFSVGEFVTMGRYPYMGPFSSLDAQDLRAIDRAMELTGTKEFADRPMDTLSGGERQEVFIAAALAQGARAMLLDEPTTFLDYKHQLEIHGILEQVNREAGVTVVSVTHDVNNALAWGDSVLALREGRAVYSGPGEGVVENGVLQRIYDTEFVLAEHPVSGRSIVIPGEKQ